METIENLRKQIDTIDDQILELIKKRMKMAQHIGQVKQMQRVPILQENREAEILGRLTQKRQELPHNLVTELWGVLFKHAKSLQFK